jgi:hypothetical protein
MPRSLGRFRTIDIPRSRSLDSAHKTLVSSYHGAHYTAERNGDALEIYALTDDLGMPAEIHGTNDKRPAISTLADLNARLAIRRRQA